jgi:hypothetical protein
MLLQFQVTHYTFMKCKWVGWKRILELHCYVQSFKLIDTVLPSNVSCPSVNTKLWHDNKRLYIANAKSTRRSQSESVRNCMLQSSASDQKNAVSLASTITFWTTPKDYMHVLPLTQVVQESNLETDKRYTHTSDSIYLRQGTQFL